MGEGLPLNLQLLRAPNIPLPPPSTTTLATSHYRAPNGRGHWRSRQINGARVYTSRPPPSQPFLLGELRPRDHVALASAGTVCLCHQPITRSLNGFPILIHMHFPIKWLKTASAGFLSGYCRG